MTVHDVTTGTTTGSCLCGGITFSIHAPLQPIQVCHCTQCRKAQGGPFAAVTPVDTAAFTLNDAQGLLRLYESSPGKERAFCGRCGSPLFSRRAALPGVLRVRAGLLDEPVNARPVWHAHTGSKSSWWPIVDDLPQHEGAHGAAPAVTLRLMTAQDLPMLHGWLNRPHIVEWWGGEAARPTMDDVLAQYHPGALAAHNVTPYIALLGSDPIGYAQSYVAMGSAGGWWEDITDPGVRGIDQSLAHPDQLGQGLGTQMVKALVALLFSDPAVTAVQTDPAPHNARAIRCYEKAGFRQVKQIVTPDGPAVYMLQTRSRA